MTQPSFHFLLIAAALSATAAAVHVACIIGGPNWYRALGAGEPMAQMAASGSSYPAMVTAAISAVLLVWAAYALAGAGVLPRLPWMRAILCAITAVYVLRGLALVPMMIMMPGRSTAFWYWSSAICLGVGIVHGLGLRQAWTSL
ncbi:hypothetical protein HF313_27515 [Massilia atriviolacea]|uniref:DUF3995 domain-containing protein n=1 Tax=Massilia atriviolacea TaxID=2495579 RepID=A0A430HJH2_9BURK|nr:hypothetical protein [Massilia atriviolacea]RSZ57651.1 hypothetical protein EJB06_18370 [Massilia atriviolacea]